MDNRLVDINICLASPELTMHAIFPIDCSGRNQKEDPENKVMCEKKTCPNIECEGLDPNYDNSTKARERYNGTRCRSTPDHGRTQLSVTVERQVTNFVQPLSCASACRRHMGCSFFTVLHISTGSPEAKVPWCYAESSVACKTGPISD